MKTVSEMSETEKAAKLADGLKVAAQRARLVDLDWLKLIDTSKVTLEEGPYGVTVKGADEVMASLKMEKPFLFGKHARDMSEAEMAAWWKDHARKFPDGGPPRAPMPTDRHMRDMSENERQEWLREYSRRIG
ncbi:hypothetical protein SAMN05443247_06636 [Bradyrhizobium erythrophlei]|nr:hypothetical protein SAMN05443247_06636 [Bradyrhizobium erythrophlei]